MAKNVAAKWRGQQLQTGQLNILGPTLGMDHLTHAGNYHTTVLIIERDFFHDLTERRLGVNFGAQFDGQSIIVPEARAFDDLTMAQQRFLNGLETDNFASSVGADDMLTALLQALISANPALSFRPANTRRHSISQKAVELIQSNLNRVVTIRELCDELDVSARTLEYSFRERFEMTPKSFMMVQRFNEARRRLRKLGEYSSVHQLVRQMQFTHAGEFARGYYHLFGELPSETLRTRLKQNVALRFSS